MRDIRPTSLWYRGNAKTDPATGTLTPIADIASRLDPLMHLRIPQILKDHGVQLMTVAVLLDERRVEMILILAKEQEGGHFEMRVESTRGQRRRTLGRDVCVRPSYSANRFQCCLHK